MKNWLEILTQKRRAGIALDNAINDIQQGKEASCGTEIHEWVSTASEVNARMVVTERFQAAVGRLRRTSYAADKHGETFQPDTASIDTINQIIGSVGEGSYAHMVDMLGINPDSAEDMRGFLQNIDGISID